MKKPKQKPTAGEKAAKRRRRKEYMTVFIRGRQKRIKRLLTIEGLSPDEFIRRNADPIWLHQNQMWEYLDEPRFKDPTLEKESQLHSPEVGHERKNHDEEEDIELPF